MNVVIFSLNRGCQLDLLLRSLKRCWQDWQQTNIHILYTMSEPRFEAGYALCRGYHPEFHWYMQRDFKESVLSLMDPADRLSMFLVDDMVWRAPWKLEGDPALVDFHHEFCLSAAVSLRLCPRINYCYSMDMKTAQPKPDPANEHFIAWNWRQHTGDWSYPHSLDAHIFRTGDIWHLLERGSYDNPNQLEDYMAARPPDRSIMRCYHDSKVFNIPMNRVQAVRENRSGNVAPEDLNEVFLHGGRLALEPLIGYQNRSCHEEVKVGWER